LDAKRDEEAAAHVYTDNSRFSRRRYYPLPRVTKKIILRDDDCAMRCDAIGTADCCAKNDDDSKQAIIERERNRSQGTPLSFLSFSRLAFRKKKRALSFITPKDFG